MDGEDAPLEALERLLCSSTSHHRSSAKLQTEKIAAVSRDDSGVGGFGGSLNVSIVSMRPLFRFVDMETLEKRLLDVVVRLGIVRASREAQMRQMRTMRARGADITELEAQARKNSEAMNKLKEERREVAALLALSRKDK
jgi:hypothetical protein